LKHFPNDIQFKYPWRKYQSRVLEELDEHLDDNHLHIIAPPGSGKTILGLEVALRLNKPTLIFAPTIAIRNQWIQRFCELFLQTEITPDWISRDIRNPKFLTVSTYQGLHAACTGKAELEEDSDEEEKSKSENKSKLNVKGIIKMLKSQNIGTIVVDEAHHLKNSWWQSLTTIKSALNPTIVGLTATPPYDVTYNEWQRYLELNGPVDAEISVPELVVEGDLCPHQDYIYFSSPTSEEKAEIDEFRQKIELLFETIKHDAVLKEALINHPIFRNPNNHLEWIYSNLEFYSAVLIFLNSVGESILPSHLEVIGDKKLNLPPLDYQWLETLLSFYLFKDSERFINYAEHQKSLLNKLKRAGGIERNTINFRNSRKINSSLSSSISKLNGIEKIVKFESNALKDDLRMVILTDYIRKEFLVQKDQNDLQLNKIGVLPIFELLRRNNESKLNIGVLTGSLVIIPIAALTSFKETAKAFGINTISTSQLQFDKNYLIVNTNEKIKHDIVHIITQVFEQGNIGVLIGTKSLLGEGWDAPSINSLVLASFVGSYVLSNQMRGRAIRTERKNILKTGNIWHLVCLEPTSEDGGDDFQLMKRRFKAFVGISFKEDITIENGDNRLDLPEELITENQIDLLNARMFNQAGNRELLKTKWHKALESGNILIEEIKVPFPEDKNYSSTKSLYYNRTILYLMGMLGSGALAFGIEALQGIGRSARHIKTSDDLIMWLLITGGLGILIFGRLAFKTFRLYIKYRDISKDVHNIAEALLLTLIKEGTIHTPKSQLEVISQVDDKGSIYCHLEGGTTFEKSSFITSLQEVIGTIHNPRYIIIRESFALGIVSQKDYHSVPESIGKKKVYAEYFASHWNRLVGKCSLVYTRTIKGRKLLLKSRIDSLSAQFEEKVERVNKWR
jgi:superfamily II DNA or RNA helicase